MSRLLKLIGIDGYHDIVIVNVMEIQTDQVWWVGCFDKVYIWTYSGGGGRRSKHRIRFCLLRGHCGKLVIFLHVFVSIIIYLKYVLSLFD